MINFAERVQSLTGLDITNDETLQSYFDAWLNDSIVELVNVLPPTQGEWITSNEILTNGDGVSIDSSKIVSVIRGFDGIDYPCKQAPPTMRSRMADSNSMFYSTVYEPSWYREGGKVYVLPEPNEGEKATIDYVKAPTSTWDSNTVDGFPDDLEPVLVYAIALKAVEHLFTIDEDEELYPPLYTILKQDYTNSLSGFLSSVGVSPPAEPKQKGGN